MMDALSPPRAFSRAWLLDESPASRQQAAWGRRYRGWLDLKTNPLAMIGLFIILATVIFSLAAPLLATHNPDAQDLYAKTIAPSATHWLGTDELGRDVYSRLLYGAQVTLGMVVSVVVITAPVGLLAGCIAGYFGGIIDEALMRVTDVFLAIPRLILALAFVAALGKGIEGTVIAIALTAWPPYARLARAETMTIRNSDYIAACRLSGASTWRIISRHVAPLCVPSLVVRMTLDMSSIIITAASLGFLGMGVKPPLSEWGTMISVGREYLYTQWWVPAAPCAAIFLVSLAFNFLGDGLRDVLDPKQS